MSASGIKVAVDARPLDIPFLRSQGIGRFAAELLAELPAVAVERGGELLLLRASTPAPKGEFEASVPAAPTLRLRRPPLPERFADFAEQALLPLDLRRTGVDVHHALSIYRAAVFPGVPSVMTIHDVIPLMWPSEYLRTGVVHRMLYRAARRATRLIAVSACARNDAAEHLGVARERIDVVYEAADERFQPVEDWNAVTAKLGIEPPYVLYVGGLDNVDPRKNVGGLIDGFADWARERGRAETLVLAGKPGPAGEPLRERARRTGARTHFAGFVADADLPALYSGASCLVSASRYEGFFLPALEALACATPVAAFEVGAIPEIAGPGAELAMPGDTPGLFRAVELLCSDPKRRAALAAAGRDHAALFSWRRSAEETWEVYERAVDEAPSN